MKDWIFCTALKTFKYEGRTYDRDHNLWVRKRHLDGLILEHKVQRIHHKNIQEK